MSKCAGRASCDTVPGFSLGEKVAIRTGFFLGVGLGAWGIWSESPVMAAGYVLLTVAAFGLLTRYTVCTRCPHLKEADDCLFMPAPLAKRIVADRSGPLSVTEYLILLLAMGSMLLPLPWLLTQPLLFGGYVLACASWMAGLYWRICPRCQVKECPLQKDATQA